LWVAFPQSDGNRSNAISTTPGDVVWLTNNNSDWNGCECNIDLSNRKCNAGRTGNESGEESHVCVKGN